VVQYWTPLIELLEALAATSRRIDGFRFVNGLTMNLLFVGAAIWSHASSAFPSEGMKIDGQVALSPAHIVAPYTIRHASNGEFIIAGADDIANHRAWATRVDKTGKPIWEFLDESPDGWNDYSKNDQSFYDAMELSNGNSLLCGVKRMRHWE